MFFHGDSRSTPITRMHVPVHSSFYWYTNCKAEMSDSTVDKEHLYLFFPKALFLTPWTN